MLRVRDEIECYSRTVSLFSFQHLFAWTPRISSRKQKEETECKVHSAKRKLRVDWTTSKTSDEETEVSDEGDGGCDEEKQPKYSTPQAFGSGEVGEAMDGHRGEVLRQNFSQHRGSVIREDRVQ